MKNFIGKKQEKAQLKKKYSVLSQGHQVNQNFVSEKCPDIFSMVELERHSTRPLCFSFFSSQPTQFSVGDKSQSSSFHIMKNIKDPPTSIQQSLVQALLLHNGVNIFLKLHSIVSLFSENTLLSFRFIVETVICSSQWQATALYVFV